jgi:hypothetical protein
MTTEKTTGRVTKYKVKVFPSEFEKPFIDRSRTFKHKQSALDYSETLERRYGAEGTEIHKYRGHVKNPMILVTLGSLDKCEVLIVRNGKSKKLLFKGHDSIAVQATADKQGIIISPVRVPK